MKSWADWRWLFRHAGTLCALVVGALALPQTARASCGDYVVMPDPHGTHGQPEPGTNAEPRHSSPQPPSPGQPVSVPLPRPCSGHSCSALPPASPPVSAAPRTVNVERWADLSGSASENERGLAFPLPFERNPAPDRHPSSIYHPPR